MDLQPDQVSAVLGEEFDDALRAKLMDVLRRLGAVVAAPERSIAGSQDLEKLDVQIGGRTLHVEVETYVGLSIRGPRELIEHVQRAMSV